MIDICVPFDGKGQVKSSKFFPGMIFLTYLPITFVCDIWILKGPFTFFSEILHRY